MHYTFFHCNNYYFILYYLTSFEESEISKIDRAKIPIFFQIDTLFILLFISLFV